MSRAFCIPGILFLTCALVLSFLASISTPFLPALDVTRIKFQSDHAAGSPGKGTLLLGELRLGIWAPCAYSTTGEKICGAKQHGYGVEILNPLNNQVTVIKSSWTRGLATQPVATAVTFIAFLLSFSTHVAVTLVASLVSFLAALITLISFAIQIALFALVKHAINDMNIGAKTITAPGFWLTFVSFILLLLAGCTVCFGRRQERVSTPSTNYPMQTTKSGKFWAKVTGKG